MLAVAALLWSASDFVNLKDRFEQARKIVGKIFRWQSAPGTSYQGFMKMFRKWNAELQLALIPAIRRQMKEVLPGYWEIAGYLVFAVDGSRIELPRTKSLEDAYSPKKKKRTGPRGRRRAKKPAQKKT